MDPGAEWTSTLKQMILEQREQLQPLYSGKEKLQIFNSETV